MTICKKCQVDKPVESFRPRSRSATGRRPVCRPCERPTTTVGRLQVAASKAAPVSGYEDMSAFRAQVASLTAEAPTLPAAKPTSKPAPVVATRTILILADFHVPEHDRGVWAAVLAWMREHQPDEVVLLGDFLELESVSEHGGSADLHRLTDDFGAGRQALKALRDAAPKADLTYLEGNHCTRLQRWIANHAPALAGSVSVPQGLALDAIGAKWVPEKEQPISRGTLDLIHGHQLPGLGKYHAGKLVEIYGVAGRIVAMGHSHRFQVVTRAMKGGNALGVALACGRTLEPGWLHGQQAGWSNGIGIATIIGGRTTLDAVPVVDGRIVWGGKVYG